MVSNLRARVRGGAQRKPYVTVREKVHKTEKIKREEDIIIDLSQDSDSPSEEPPENELEQSSQDSTSTPRKKVSFTFQSTPNTPSSTGGILKRSGRPQNVSNSEESDNQGDLRSMLAKATRKLQQKTNLGGPDDTGFGDGGQRFSIYSGLNSYLRGDISSMEDLKSLVAYAPTLSECARKDIITADSSSNALDTRVVIQAVRFLAYLLVEPSVAEAVDSETVTWVVNLGLAKIADPNCSKSVLAGYLHLLSHHRVCKNVVTPETMSLMYTELARSEKKSSTALTSEVLSIYQTVAVVHPGRALQQASLWLPRVLCLAMDCRTGLRNQALSVLSDFIAAAGPNNKTLTAKTSRLLSAPFSLETARNEGAQLAAWLKPKENYAETILQAALDCPPEDPHYELWGLTLLMAPLDAERGIHSWSLLPQWLAVAAPLTDTTKGSAANLALLKACRYVVYTHTRKNLVKYPAGLHSLATRSGNSLLLCIQPLGKTGNQAIDQQCLSLFNQTLNTLLPALETNQLTLKANSLLWDSYIRPTLEVMASNPSLANVACASLACLLRVDQKVQKDREPVFSTSIRQLVASLSPRWVKLNYQKIIDIAQTIPLDITGAGPNFMAVWSALVSNITSSASREIHPSIETSGFVMSACKLHRHLAPSSLDHMAFYNRVFQVAGMSHCVERVTDGISPTAYMFETLVEADETLEEATKFLHFIYDQLPGANKRLLFTQSVATLTKKYDVLYDVILDRTNLDITGSQTETLNLSPKGIYSILATNKLPPNSDTWMSILRAASEVIRRDSFLGSIQELLIEPLLQIIDPSLHHEVCLLGIEMIDKKPRTTASPMFRLTSADLSNDFLHLGAISSDLATPEIVAAVKKCLNSVPDHSIPCFVYRFSSLVIKAIEITDEKNQKYVCDSIIRKLRNGTVLSSKAYIDLLINNVFPAWFEEYQDALKKFQIHIVTLWNELIGKDPDITTPLDDALLDLLITKYVSTRQEVLCQGQRLEKPNRRRTSRRVSSADTALATPNASPSKRKSGLVDSEPQTTKTRRLSLDQSSPIRRSSPRISKLRSVEESSLENLATQTMRAIDTESEEMSEEQLQRVESTLIEALYKLNKLKRNSI